MASGVMIVRRVNIGDNVIQGARAVFIKNILSIVFAAGVPAKVIKKS